MSNNTSWLTTNFSLGEMTLEILSPDKMVEKTIAHLPKDWFQYLDENLKPSSPGKGNLFLTRKGWEENEEAIRDAYFEAVDNGSYQGDLFHNKTWIEGEFQIYPHEKPLLWEELTWHVEYQLKLIEQAKT
jgi:hypothetical protein